MYDTLVYYTFILLLLFFFGIEFYKMKNYIKGEIIGFNQQDMLLGGMVGSRLKVQLKNGSVIEAEAERCTMCMGDFQVGEEVRLIKSNDKYTVHLP
ncbi:MAG: hypothetical protein V2J62_09470, partial [candidate division KSB1 bacterium]|nr:hypothetical protein [candidate division KSB1 bacterium]